MREAWLPRALARLGHVLRPLFNPDAAWERDRLETILREQREAAAALQKRAGAQTERLTETRHEVEQLRRNLSGLRSRLTRELQLSERVLRKLTDRGVEINEERVLDRVHRIARSQRPIIVGPWTGEVGFELIYWIPFVRWALGQAGIEPSRVTIVSRGGPQPWYEGMGSRYLDVLDVSTPEEFRAGTTVNRKQRALWAYDRELARRAARALGGAPVLLHPMLMYVLFMPYWRQDASIHRIVRHSHYRRYEPPPLPPLVGRLPERFTAVRFYFSQCFPDTPENRRFIAGTIDALAAESDVVVLRAGIGLDDHVDIAAERRGRVHVVDAGTSPRDNLAIQTAVISRAASFVGTYGGFCYLAPLYGVNTVAFYSLPNFQVSHLQATQRIITDVDGGRLIPLHVTDAALLRFAADAGTARLPV